MSVSRLFYFLKSRGAYDDEEEAAYRSADYKQTPLLPGKATWLTKGFVVDTWERQKEFGYDPAYSDPSGYEGTVIGCALMRGGFHLEVYHPGPGSNYLVAICQPYTKAAWAVKLPNPPPDFDGDPPPSEAVKR